MKFSAPKDFHAFTLKAKARANCIVSAVSVFPAFDPFERPIPYEPHQTSALWDTGATNSVVTTETIQALGLTPIGKAKVSHGGGTDERDTYIVNLGLPNNVMIPGVIVTEMPSASGFGVIIGMNIIALGDFSSQM